MPRLQGHFTSSGANKPLVRVFAAFVLVLLSLVVLAIAVVVAIIAIPLVLVAWVVISLRRLWMVRRSDAPESRVNVRVREFPR